MKDPFYIQWHITNFCNLRCKHCYQDDFSKKSDLDGAGLKIISDNILAALKTWDRTACIHLTGGEPLLKPELFLLWIIWIGNPPSRNWGSSPMAFPSTLRWFESSPLFQN